MNLQVDRLALRISGIPEVDGRRLAQLVGDALATATPPATDGTVDALRVSVETRPGEALESTARRIAAELLRVLVRAL